MNTVYQKLCQYQTNKPSVTVDELMEIWSDLIDISGDYIKTGQAHLFEMMDIYLAKVLSKLDNDEKEQIVCTICQREITSEILYKTRCEHFFHRGCIMTWNKIKTTCPMCRGDLKNIIFAVNY